MENSFGQHLAQALKDANLSQKKAADLIGVNHYSVGRWIAGKAEPTKRNQARILRLIADITRAGEENVFMVREPDAPLYDVRGVIPILNDAEPLPFRRDIAEHLFRVDDQDAWLAFMLTGSEMQPLLSHDAIALVRKGPFNADGAHLVEIDGVPMVRMVQKLPGGKFRVTTLNNAFGTIEVSEGELTITGRVVAKIDRI